MNMHTSMPGILTRYRHNIMVYGGLYNIPLHLMMRPGMIQY